MAFGILLHLYRWPNTPGKRRFFSIFPNPSFHQQSVETKIKKRLLQVTNHKKNMDWQTDKMKHRANVLSHKKILKRKTIEHMNRRMNTGCKEEKVS